MADFRVLGVLSVPIANTNKTVVKLFQFDTHSGRFNWHGGKRRENNGLWCEVLRGFTGFYENAVIVPSFIISPPLRGEIKLARGFKLEKPYNECV